MKLLGIINLPVRTINGKPAERRRVVKTYSHEMKTCRVCGHTYEEGHYRGHTRLYEHKKSLKGHEGWK